MSVLVIDAGSSSVRALIFDDALQVLHLASRMHSFDVTPDGGVTADPVALRTLVEACIDEVLAALRGPLECVGFASFVGNFLGVDSSGMPVTPISTYADTRALVQLEQLCIVMDPATTHERTGCPLALAYHPARLRYFLENGIYAARWLDFATHCYETWFGQRVPCSYSIAAWSGLLNRHTLQWDREWLALLGLDESHFPPLADVGAARVGLSANYAERWPALGDVPFCLAVGDGVGANIGSGATNGQLAITVGTTAAVRILTPEAPSRFRMGLWSYRADATHHLTGGAMTEGGSVYGWIRRMFALPPDAENQLANTRPDSHGLTFLPFLAGERSPGYNARAVGTLHGLRLATSQLEVLQAALEGIAHRLALIADLLDVPPGPVYASGGALAASPLWVQIIADALDRPIYQPVERELTARGTAILALHALRGSALDAFPPHVAAAPVTPRAAFVPVMRAARERQERLYNTLKGTES